MLILNTGGTFNKRYDPLLGELYVPEDNRALHLIVDRFTHPLPIEGMIYKDSLEMDDGDREALVQRILQVPYDRCIVVHGTDTMDQSAAWVF